MTKNQQIKQTIAETKEKRKQQQCSVIEIKIDKSHMSKQQKQQLHKLFLETKWLYNHLVAQEDIFNFNTKINQVPVKVIDQFETRKIKLGAQIKQAILDKTITNIKALSTKKKKGEKVGKLKFKSQINSVPLKQYNNTYKIKNNRVKIQNIKKPIKVIGLKQIKSNWDITNAKILKRQDDYFLHITVYKPKEEVNNGKYIGLDFGIRDSITFSNGLQIDTEVPLSEKVKQEHRKLSRKQKGSKNHKKQKIKLQKAYQEVTNKRKDIRDKLRGYLKRNFEYIAVQDENIKGWHSTLYGKNIQQSTIGGIIAGIKKLPQTTIVDRYFPSTQKCPICGTLNQIGDSKIYYCSCGYSMDRDIHAANNILDEAFSLPTERRFKPVENNASIVMAAWFSDNCKHCLVKQEAQLL